MSAVEVGNDLRQIMERLTREAHEAFDRALMDGAQRRHEEIARRTLAARRRARRSREEGWLEL